MSQQGPSGSGVLVAFSVLFLSVIRILRISTAMNVLLLPSPSTDLSRRPVSPRTPRSGPAEPGPSDRAGDPPEGRRHGVRGSLKADQGETQGPSRAEQWTYRFQRYPLTNTSHGSSGKPPICRGTWASEWPWSISMLVSRSGKDTTFLQVLWKSSFLHSISWLSSCKISANIHSTNVVLRWKLRRAQTAHRGHPTDLHHVQCRCRARATTSLSNGH